MGRATSGQEGAVPSPAAHPSKRPRQQFNPVPPAVQPTFEKPADSITRQESAGGALHLAIRRSPRAMKSGAMLTKNRKPSSQIVGVRLPTHSPNDLDPWIVPRIGGPDLAETEKKEHLVTEIKPHTHKHRFWRGISRPRRRVRAGRAATMHEQCCFFSTQVVRYGACHAVGRRSLALEGCELGRGMVDLCNRLFVRFLNKGGRQHE